jgi:hypothetical protein
MQSDAGAYFVSGSQAAAIDGTRGADTLSTGDHHPEEDPAEKARDWERRARELAKKGDHEAAAKAYEQAALYWKKAGESEKAGAATKKAEEQKKLAEADGKK